MQQRELLEHFDKRIEDLRSELKDDNNDIKQMLSQHLEHCDKSMKGHGDDIKDLQAHKNKVIGALALIGFVLTLLVSVLGIKGLL